MRYENKHLGLARPELAPLQTAIFEASQLIIPEVSKRVVTLSGNSLEREAARKVAEVVDILVSRQSTHFLSQLTFNKKSIRNFQEMEQEYIEKGLSQELIQDAQSCQNLSSYKVYFLFEGLRRIREEMGLTLHPKDIRDARAFEDNWALFIRGLGLLAGPPWEPDVFKPSYSQGEEGDGIPYEGDKLEISLAYLHFQTQSINTGATNIRVFAAPLVTIGYDGKPIINVITGQNKRFYHYSSDDSHLFRQVMPVKSPLRYQLIGR